MTSSKILILLLFSASGLVFLWSLYRRLSLVQLGRDENRLDRFGDRFSNMLLYAFGQKRVLARPYGINHAIFFWACLFLVAVNLEFVLGGIFPALHLSHLPAFLYFPIRLISDIVSLMTLGAVVAALVRRTFFPLYPEARNFEGYFIVAVIAVHMLAYFGINATELTLGQERAGSWMPVSLFASRFLADVSPTGLENLGAFSWWVHALALLVIFNYLIPYSKHLHVITAIGNCFFRPLDNPGTPKRETFEPGENFGADSVTKLTWKDLFDSLACTECGRCEEACPAWHTGKTLNPRRLIHDIKVNLLGNAEEVKKGNDPILPLIGGSEEGSCQEEAIWDCTTCGACLEACPVFIEHPHKTIQMRRFLVQERARFPEELLNLFENTEQRSNPWGMPPADRAKWCSPFGDRPYDAESCDYLFFVGCAGAYDNRSKHVTAALGMILDAAGVSWGILGKEELCCGDSLRKLGNEYVFDQLARQNVSLFKERGVKKIVTQCPHCFNTLKNDYRQYGVEVEVIHHSELILDLLEQGRLTLPGTVSQGRMVFHDSCYLGRHNGTFTAPRQVLKKATGQEPGDLTRNKENGFCCGAGGGRMWMEELSGTRINLERVKEALQEKPDTICVTCPYCMTMLGDGLKDEGEDQVRVKDIAEVVAESLNKS
ncbi:MAG: electron transfer flavoprotein [Desulfuromonas sp.]|nr:MAG: electron transfer flavoprotein [Desulfuromonas sp.]